jgi:hypothetical protein
MKIGIESKVKVKLINKLTNKLSLCGNKNFNKFFNKVLSMTYYFYNIEFLRKLSLKYLYRSYEDSKQKFCTGYSQSAVNINHKTETIHAKQLLVHIWWNIKGVPFYEILLTAETANSEQ